MTRVTNDLKVFKKPSIPEDVVRLTDIEDFSYAFLKPVELVTTVNIDWTDFTSGSPDENGDLWSVFNKTFMNEPAPEWFGENFCSTPEDINTTPLNSGDFILVNAQDYHSQNGIYQATIGVTPDTDPPEWYCMLRRFGWTKTKRPFLVLGNVSGSITYWCVSNPEIEFKDSPKTFIPVSVPAPPQEPGLKKSVTLFEPDPGNTDTVYEVELDGWEDPVIQVYDSSGQQLLADMTWDVDAGKAVLVFSDPPADPFRIVAVG